MVQKPTLKRAEEQLALVYELASIQLQQLERQSTSTEHQQSILQKQQALIQIKPLVLHAYEVRKALLIAKDCMGNPAAMIFRAEYLRAFNRVLKISKPTRPYHKRAG